MSLKTFFDNSEDYINKYIGSPSLRLEGLSTYEADVRPILPSYLKTIFDDKYKRETAEITVSKIGLKDYLGLAILLGSAFLILKIT